jgi:hypothetical protein
MIAPQLTEFLLSIAPLPSNRLLLRKTDISILECNIGHEGIPIYEHAYAIAPRFPASNK